ncbi:MULTISPECIES: hypothetical protein [Aestuariibaculum]|uniref:Lipopolysaccharide assembly protein A domain-containing protein n=1 Tax=Aestuariibaculum lutulentum TaxID=2920935 RepID=A0ABS9RLW2_9FLAO|nr:MULTISPECIES: hypothetical protein [Aestuariibaculum]MCH4553930.1 hypothetical protein [Aestuariibaculum lutulentum]MCR8669425.1 hypothetical protein [Aestuariibaculum sp. M13]
MKIATIVISVLALALVVFNATKINFSAPLQGESSVAIITILASLCAILIMLILYTSKRIEQKVKERR